MEFTCVIDGINLGGYLLTIRKGNGVTFRMFASDQPSIIQGDGNVNVPLVASNVILTQNTGNSEACINLNTNEKIPFRGSDRILDICRQILMIILYLI